MFLRISAKRGTGVLSCDRRSHDGSQWSQLPDLLYDRTKIHGTARLSGLRNRQRIQIGSVENQRRDFGEPPERWDASLPCSPSDDNENLDLPWFDSAKEANRKRREVCTTSTAKVSFLLRPPGTLNFVQRDRRPQLARRHWILIDLWPVR